MCVYVGNTSQFGGKYSSSDTNIFPQDVFKGTSIPLRIQNLLHAFGVQFTTRDNFFRVDPPQYRFLLHF
jgi:hypothetical protein